MTAPEYRWAEHVAVVDNESRVALLDLHASEQPQPVILEDTAAEIWLQFASPTSLEQAIVRLVDRFGAGADRQTQITDFVQELLARGWLTDQAPEGSGDGTD